MALSSLTSASLAGGLTGGLCACSHALSACRAMRGRGRGQNRGRGRPGCDADAPRARALAAGGRGREPSPAASSHAGVGEVYERMAALQRGDASGLATCVALARRLEAALPQAFERELRGHPQYAPLFGCSRWEAVGALPMSGALYLVRIRVYPAFASSAPFAAACPKPADYVWTLKREDSRQDQGCAWIVEDVELDPHTPL